jgi:hypothetical protein
MRLMIVTLIVATIVECSLRAIVVKGPALGMPMFLSVPLLPLTPSEAQLRTALERRPRGDADYIVPDAELGWTIAPNGKDGDCQSDAQAARAAADRVFTTAVPPGKTRLVVVGDSFTHGDEVRGDETWASYLERDDPTLEVINYGVPGYGTDQSVLRYRRDGRCFESDFAVLGIWPENICRNLNVIRYYLAPGGGIGVKPRFKLANAGLVLVGSPIPSDDEIVSAMTAPLDSPLLKDECWVDAPSVSFYPTDHLYIARVLRSICNASSRRSHRQRLYSGEDRAGIDLTVAIAREFANDVRKAGRARPTILLIPMRDLLDMHREEPPLPLVAALREAGLDVIDAGPAMSEAVSAQGANSMYKPSGHLTPKGNELIAQVVRREVNRRLQPTSPAAASGPR